MRLWHAGTGEALRTLSGHEGWVWSVAIDPTGAWLASAGEDGTVRLWDVRATKLLWNGAARSARADLISETLQRLWGYRLDGLQFVRDLRKNLWPRKGYHIEQTFEIDVRPADADPTSQPVMHCFDIRPLLDPPPKGKDKLDQILNWVKEQEPWLKPTHEPKRCEGVGQAG